jgi:hypothetical protein
MDVYAPAEEPLVVFVGNGDSTGEGFVDSLKRFVGAIGLLGAASALLQWFVWSQSSGTEADGLIRIGDALQGTGAVVGIPAGALFFAGGALMLAIASSWRYYRRSS